jgi:hypothetical protein
MEWSLHVAHFAVLDYLRDRGEPDGDTASEVLRVIFRTHDPRGRAALAAAIAAGGVVLHRHLCKPA